MNSLCLNETDKIVDSSKTDYSKILTQNKLTENHSQGSESRSYTYDISPTTSLNENDANTKQLVTDRDDSETGEQLRSDYGGPRRVELTVLENVCINQSDLKSLHEVPIDFPLQQKCEIEKRVDEPIDVTINKYYEQSNDEEHAVDILHKENNEENVFSFSLKETLNINDKMQCDTEYSDTVTITLKPFNNRDSLNEIDYPFYTIQSEKKSQMQNRKNIFSEESAKLTLEIPETLCGDRYDESYKTNTCDNLTSKVKEVIITDRVDLQPSTDELKNNLTVSLGTEFDEKDFRGRSDLSRFGKAFNHTDTIESEVKLKKSFEECQTVIPNDGANDFSSELSGYSEEVKIPIGRTSEIKKAPIDEEMNYQRDSLRNNENILIEIVDESNRSEEKPCSEQHCNDDNIDDDLLSVKHKTDEYAYPINSDIRNHETSMKSSCEVQEQEDDPGETFEVNGIVKNEISSEKQTLDEIKCKPKRKIGYVHPLSFDGDSGQGDLSSALESPNKVDRHTLETQMEPIANSIPGTFSTFSFRICKRTFPFFLFFVLFLST